MQRTHIHTVGKFLREHGVLLLILAVAIAVRFFALGSIPPGLNQDEASTGYDAYAILQYGVDRHGFSYPLHLVSWGSGMYALAAYATVPFLVMFDLSPFAMRLPHAVFGVIAVLALFEITRRIVDRRTALLAAFLLAISPWHVMASRWGLDSNLFPPTFLFGVYVLICSLRRPWLFPLACAFFGLCLYSYGTAYVVVPAFLFLIVPFLRVHWQIGWKPLLTGGAVFGCLALPVALFLLVNRYEWSSIALGPLSIPHLLGVPRYHTAAELPHFSAEYAQSMLDHMKNLWHLLSSQDDDTLYNVLPGFGYMYLFSMPFALIGLFLSIQRLLHRRQWQYVFMLAWFAACIPLAIMLRDININRINILLLPIIFFLSVGISECVRGRVLLAALVGTYLLSFTQFTAAYFHEFPQQIGPQFFESLDAAINEASQRTNGSICITENINMPYIFVLFSRKMYPYAFSQTVQYENPGAEFQQVRSFDRYLFGLDHCDREHTGAFVVDYGELPLFENNPSYDIVRFKNYAAVIHQFPSAEHVATAFP